MWVIWLPFHARPLGSVISCCADGDTTTLLLAVRSFTTLTETARRLARRFNVWTVCISYAGIIDASQSAAGLSIVRHLARLWWGCFHYGTKRTIAKTFPSSPVKFSRPLCERQSFRGDVSGDIEGAGFRAVYSIKNLFCRPDPVSLTQIQVLHFFLRYS